MKTMMMTCVALLALTATALAGGAREFDETLPGGARAADLVHEGTRMETKARMGPASTMAGLPGLEAERRAALAAAAEIAGHPDSVGLSRIVDAAARLDVLRGSYMPSDPARRQLDEAREKLDALIDPPAGLERLVGVKPSCVGEIVEDFLSEGMSVALAPTRSMPIGDEVSAGCHAREREEQVSIIASKDAGRLPFKDWRPRITLQAEKSELPSVWEYLMDQKTNFVLIVNKGEGHLEVQADD